MTTVQLTLPDDLAQVARKAGLLTPEALEALVRTAIREQSLNDLFGTMDKLSALDPPPLTEAELAQEIAEVRRQRRDAAGR